MKYLVAFMSFLFSFAGVLVISYLAISFFTTPLMEENYQQPGWGWPVWVSLVLGVLAGIQGWRKALKRS